MNVPLRDHGFYWVEYLGHPDYPKCTVIAEWCYLCAAGCHVWFLPGDEDYRFDTQVDVISRRIPEPGASLFSRIRDFLGMRDKRRKAVIR